MLLQQRRARETYAYRGAARSPADLAATCYIAKRLLSLHNPVARAARALAGRYTGSEQASRAARKGLYWFSKPNANVV